MSRKLADFSKQLLFAFYIFLLFLPGTADAQKKNKLEAYLFAYFTGNRKEQEQVHFAISNDGYNFSALNGNRPVIASEKISSSGGIRDPHILRGADGKTFYMVATDMVAAKGWDSNRAIVLLKSNDLINWTSSVVNFQERFPGFDNLKRVWAPQTIFDPVKKKYMVYFSLKQGDAPDKLYYAYANASFTGLDSAPVQLFQSPSGAACIDPDIILKDGRYHLFFKGENGAPGIKLAVSDRLTQGYQLLHEQVQQTSDPVEGASVFKLNDGTGYILMYDVYTKGRYQFTRSTDLQKFSIVDAAISMDFKPRHGTVVPITAAECQRLTNKWLTAESVIRSVRGKGLRQMNVYLDSVAKRLYLPLKPDVDPEKFLPVFPVFPGVRVRKVTPVSFSNGPVKYAVTIRGKTPAIFELTAEKYHNPVLEGYYADPEILFAKKDGRFYIYPTTDGFTGWAGNYFKAFSSGDLVNWKDEGKILDLPKDVSWGKSNAWAPCILEKKINGNFRYFYYFTANKQIGVAVSDNPTGPFVDSGKPLIDKLPDGITRGLQIDPDVFEDPVSGKTYLYWGNAYMAGAELNDDLLSIKKETLKILTPDKTFGEGTYVFYRNGKYYFTWSENDTRSEDYRVRWGIADSPLSKIKVPGENNLVIAKNPKSGIYGTGHHSILQLPGKDEWYIVYHRFNYPAGIQMGAAAGYNREVAIDKLNFTPDGAIIQVIPTHEGISPVVFKP